jgi:hypothetical protein
VSITKVVAFSTTNPTKLSLHLSEFSMGFYAFYKFQQFAYTVKIPFCTGDPTKIGNVTTMPLVCNKHPRKTGGLAIGALDMGGGGAS